MAWLDREMQGWLWLLVCPFASWCLLRRHFSAIQQYCFACFMSRFAPFYNKVLGGRKKQLFYHLHEQAKNSDKPLLVLEVGAGTGANFQYVPPKTQFICLEPNSNFRSFIYKSAEESKVKIQDFVVGIGEDMTEVQDNSVDAVIITLVLCSVSSVELCVQEAKRVLKPGGKLYFLEHVLAASGSWLNTLQRLMSPLNMQLFDGCQLTRQPWWDIKDAGFRSVEYDLFDTNFKMVTIRPHCIGIATK